MAALTPITDPDDIVVGTEVTLDYAARTFTLVEAGNLDGNGVAFQALTDAFIDYWQADATAQGFSRPPIESFGAGRGVMIDGWRPANEATRKLIRDGSWQEFDLSGNLVYEVIGCKTLGNIDSTAAQTGDFAFWYWSNDSLGDAPTAFDYAGEVNEILPLKVETSAMGTRTFATTTITRTTGSWITDGLVVGREVTINNAGSAGNNGTHICTAVTATVATFAASTFTAGADSTANFLVDYSNEVLSVAVREEAKTFGFWTSAQSLGTGVRIGFQVIPFSVAEEADDLVDATLTDLVIDPNSDGSVADSGQTDVAGVTLTGYTTAQAVSGFSGGSFNFGWIIDANDTARRRLYTVMQFLKRQSVDVVAGGQTVVGQKIVGLTDLPGGPTGIIRTLATTPDLGGGTGVAISSLNANDTNFYEAVDNLGTIRTLPSVASGSITFNSVLQGDADAVYRMLFTTNPAGDYGTITAVTVNDNGGTPIAGSVGGSGSVSWDYDYTGNVQGGRTGNTDADVTIFFTGKTSAQPGITQGTIVNATGQTFACNAVLQRNYVNP